jgi:hypothetical protein
VNSISIGNVQSITSQIIPDEDDGLAMRVLYINSDSGNFKLYLFALGNEIENLKIATKE